MYIFEVRYNDVYKFYFTYDRFVILSLRNNGDRLERRRRKKKWNGIKIKIFQDEK